MSARAEVTIRLVGQDHVIRAEGDQDQLEECARLLIARIEEMRRGASGISEQRAVILAALSIVNDLLATRREMDVRLGEIMDWVGKLNDQIEAVLEPDEG